LETFYNPSVKDIFDTYLPHYQAPLLQIRQWIFDVANENPSVGPLEETLKWGQPSYLTPTTKSGSTIRIDWFDEGKIGIFLNCQTTLIETFRSMFADTLQFSKNRAIVLDASKPLPESEIKQCIKMALLYHQSRKVSA